MSSTSVDANTCSAEVISGEAGGVGSALVVACEAVGWLVVFIEPHPL